MSSEALQTLQISANTLACLSGLQICSVSLIVLPCYHVPILSFFFNQQAYISYLLCLRYGRRIGMPQCHRRDRDGSLSPCMWYAAARCYFMRLTLLRRFLDLLTHFVTRSLQFARARHMKNTNEELLSWTIPLTVSGK
jgi:hypothetical protein